MSKNNHVELIGNMGSEARIIEREGKSSMAAFSLATQDSYKDKEDKWVNKESIWHNVLCFNPVEIEKLKNLKTGTRIKVIGSLSYKEMEAITRDDGQKIAPKEASIIGSKIELAPLTPK